MNHTIFVYSGILCIIAIACAGCTGPGLINPATSTPTPSPAGTAITVGTIVVDEEQNGATTSLDPGRTITIRLQ